MPLQNFQSNITGLTQYTTIASNVANLQKMVDFTTKTVRTDVIEAYTTGNVIQVQSAATSASASASGSIGGSSGSASITNGGTTIQTYTTVGVTSTLAISLGVRNTSVFNILGNGNVVYNDPTGVATSFAVEGVTFSAPAGVFSTLTTGSITTGSITTGSITAGSITAGTCYATNYVTLSDKTVKRNIREWREPVLYTLKDIKPYAYIYDGEDSAGPGHIGLLAQDVAAVYPQCVSEGAGGTYVNYDSVVALLVGAVRELSARVASLEGSASSPASRP